MSVSAATTTFLPDFTNSNIPKIEALVNCNSNKVLQNNKVNASTILPGKIVNFDVQRTKTVIEPQYPPICCELKNSTEWIKKYG